MNFVPTQGMTPQGVAPAAAPSAGAPQQAVPSQGMPQSPEELEQRFQTMLTPEEQQVLIAALTHEVGAVIKKLLGFGFEGVVDLGVNTQPQPAPPRAGPLPPTVPRLGGAG